MVSLTLGQPVTRCWCSAVQHSTLLRSCPPHLINRRSTASYQGRQPAATISDALLAQSRTLCAARRVFKVMAASAQGGGAGDGKIRVLFVCLGNICRSPSAEAVFRAVAEREGLADRFEIDSCGTGGGNPNWYFTEDPSRGWSYHEGDAADPRMRQAAERRQVYLTSKSRPLTPQDLTSFDHIIGMDNKNMADMQVAVDHWAAQHEISPDYRNKITKMTSYLRADKYMKYDEVPDPYFAAPGEQSGFELVLDLLDDACEGFLETLNVK